MTKSAVKTYSRADGTVVRAHDRHTPDRQPSDEEQAAVRAASRQAFVGRDDDQQAVEQWQDRPVSLSEASAMLTVSGCGKAAHLAPLVQIAQGPHGTTITTVPYTPTGGAEPVGGLEIVDPFAVSGEDRSAVVNGRFLQDAIKSHGQSGAKSMAAADIHVGDSGEVSVGGAEVRDLDGLDEAGRVASKRISEIKQQARRDGVSERSMRARATAAYLDSEGLGDGYVDAYVAIAAKRPLPSEETLESLEAFHTYLHDLTHDINAVVPIANHEAEILAHRYENSGTEMPREEWLTEQAKRAHEAAKKEARLRFKNTARYSDDLDAAYDEKVDEWGEEQGHDMAALRAAASPPGKYEGATQSQHLALGKAVKSLESCGAPAWESQTSAAAFGTEASVVASAAGANPDRPMLSLMHFGDTAGRRRMTATDAYRIMSTSAEFPQALSEGDHAMSAACVSAWTRHAQAHLGDSGRRAPLGVAHSIDGDGRHHYGLHAGQMRVAMQGALPDTYPDVDRLISRGAGHSVTIPTDAFAVPRGKGIKASKSQVTILAVRQDDSGQPVSLHWQRAEASALGDVESEGDVLASGRGRPSGARIPEVIVNSSMFGDAVRFASAGGSEVGVRNMDPLKPMLIVPADAPADLRRTERFAIQMPTRRG